MCIHCETGEDGDCQCDEIERLRSEIARLREENETLRDYWPTFWKPLSVAVKEVGK